MRYRIHTYGCQMNDRDSEALAAVLDQLGHRAIESDQEPDLVLFNTCCVRDNAERKIVGKILEYRMAKEERPELIVVVAGCMMQQPGAAERLAAQAPWLDLILGTLNADRLPALLATAVTRASLRIECGGQPLGPVIEIGATPPRADSPQPRRLRSGAVNANVSVSFGCNNYCSYCIVPYVRGPERSRSPQAIVDEVTTLARAGVREVTLLGQNVNSYGSDLAPRVSFAALLASLDAAVRPVGLARIRFMTSHPKDLSPALIKAMADLPTVCEHIHLPVQAGSDVVLGSMNRGYSAAHYLDLVSSLRDAMPAVGLTTDIIVGFPGESDADFEATLDLVRAARFDGAFTFAYSVRKGTAAAVMPGQIPAAQKRERLAALNRLQDAISHEQMAKLLGTEQEVLFEGPSPKDPRMIAGRTRGFHYVLTPGSVDLVGSVGRVRITATRTWTLTGELLSLLSAAGGDEVDRHA